MKNAFWAFFLCLILATVAAGETVSVPWEEWKHLYRESIEHQIRAEMGTPPFVCSFDQAAYTLSVSENGCSGDLVLSGRVLSGQPEPLTVFNKNLVIRQIRSASGGALLCEPDSDVISFLPTAAEPFRISLSFSLPVQEDQRSKFVSLDIPPALQNTLRIEFPRDFVLIEAPGIKDTSGGYSFPSRPTLVIRFADKKEQAAVAAAEAENLSKQYKTINTPSIVLDAISYFISFDENGSALSVLMMDIPPEAGAHLTLAAIPDTKIWSLKVNGEKRNIYGNQDNESQWIVPLCHGKSSHVELALIRQSAKMGLRGRLETVVPKMELPALKVNVAIALPERVQLLSMEGPVTPSLEAVEPAPAEFIGKPYFFSRSFYTGEGMNIALSYQEPVK